ncbi:hypothetical protein SynSYN20_02732 [Synechococcus sp. SYN20]|nr:hypothetical protein SynSYN20_02732 [Synechococcus sp. SYN20]
MIDLAIEVLVSLCLWLLLCFFKRVLNRNFPEERLFANRIILIL